MTRSGIVRRMTAAAIDGGLALAGGYLLSFTGTGHYFAERAVVALAIGQPGSLWVGPIPMVMGMVGHFTYVLPLAFLLVRGIEGMRGASPGKLLTGLRVARIAGPGGEEFPPGRRWRRTAVTASPFWLIAAGLVAGSAVIMAGGMVAGVALLIGSVAALGRSRLTLHDRLTKSCVERRGS